MTEIWKQISGYEGLYEVSNFGRVKSLCAGRWHTVMIRKPVPDKEGYYTVCLKKDGKYKNHKIHRLVAIEFIENPNNYPQINHKDKDVTNNRVENLEWCSSEYNLNYGDRIKKYYKSVVQKDQDGNTIRTYESIKDAEKETGVLASSISCVLSGKRKKAGGYKWECL